jgi:hypothetical protein
LVMTERYSWMSTLDGQGLSTMSKSIKTSLLDKFGREIKQLSFRTATSCIKFRDNRWHMLRGKKIPCFGNALSYDPTRSWDGPDPRGRRMLVIESDGHRVAVIESPL